METVTNKKHQEVLHWVFSPDTKFDQSILNYKDIKGVQGASCCPNLKTKIVKCRFEDQEDA